MLVRILVNISMDGKRETRLDFISVRDILYGETASLRPETAFIGFRRIVLGMDMEQELLIVLNEEAR